MTNLTTEARADIASALAEGMSAGKCKADHVKMAKAGKATCAVCKSALGSKGVQEGFDEEQAQLRESVLHNLETFDPTKHPRGRTGRFIDILNKLKQDHSGTPDGHRFGLAAQNLHRYGKVNAFDQKPLRKLGPEASAQLIHMLTPLSLVSHPTAHTHSETNLLRPSAHKITSQAVPDHGPSGGHASSLKPLNLEVGPYEKVSLGKHGPMQREIHATVSKRRFRFAPVQFDQMNPNPAILAGRTVRVTKLHGAPPPGTMGQYHVADEKGNLLGMVHGNSLKPLPPMKAPAQSKVGRSTGPAAGSLDDAKPDRWNDRWDSLSLLRGKPRRDFEGQQYDFANTRVQDAADAILDGGKGGPGKAHIPGSGGATDTLAPEVLKAKHVNDLAEMVENDWGPKVNFAARPYLDAMRGMRGIDSTFGLDSGRTVVAYFLSNATGWRGPVAKAVKKELKRRLDSKPGSSAASNFRPGEA